jgi:hypothetical protein
LVTIIVGLEEKNLNKVFVVITAYNQNVYELVKERIKEGSVCDKENKKITTWVYVESVEEFRDCLTHKHDVGKKMWHDEVVAAKIIPDEEKNV